MPHHFKHPLGANGPTSWNKSTTKRQRRHYHRFIALCLLMTMCIIECWSCFPSLVQYTQHDLTFAIGNDFCLNVDNIIQLKYTTTFVGLSIAMWLIIHFRAKSKWASRKTGQNSFMFDNGKVGEQESHIRGEHNKGIYLRPPSLSNVNTLGPLLGRVQCGWSIFEISQSHLILQNSTFQVVQAARNWRFK